MFSSDFEEDFYDNIPESAVPSSSSTGAEQERIIPLDEMITREQEDELIRQFLESVDSDWQRYMAQVPDAYKSGGYRGGTGFRGGRGTAGFGRKANVYVRPTHTPAAIPIPDGYVCHRCKVPGHMIQHCPTNGNPDYDLGNSKPPAAPNGYLCRRCNVPGHLIQHCPTNGDPAFDNFNNSKPPRIPMPIRTTEHDSCALPSGGPAAVSQPVVQGIPSSSTSSSSQQRVIPPELHCPLCKHVMKDAVLTSKCCFASFCYTCIESHIVSNCLSCVCGATNILADYLLPNKTLRNTINRYLESDYSSSNNSRGTTSVQDESSLINDDQFAAKKRKMLDSPSELATGNKRERLIDKTKCNSRFQVCN